jgi:DNA-binding transcriptional regulator YdaS (Cro superfamily)
MQMCICIGMKITPTRFEALQQVAAAFPSQQAMADLFGVTQPTVWRWLHQAKQLPAEHVLAAERASGVSRHHLRPDIYPVEPHHPARLYGVDFDLSPCATAVSVLAHRGQNDRAVA